MNDRIARMERRIESLTKEKNAAMEALELASSLGTFDTGMGRCAESGDVIHELLRRVVDMLDAFHELVSDLSTGLPGELAARRKQYEYYRDRLLTFPVAS